MAELRVFVSSTCYDLSLLRSQLRLFIKNMGYEPIMSDYEDVLYDPRSHTHTSCIDEVKNCDVLILIIGSRFGGKATAEALSRVDFNILSAESSSVESLKDKDNLSVTQLEVLKAIEESIPVYTFIDKRVWNDHELYEKNKSSDIIDKILFPAIEKQETAKYIFEFINFVRLRTKGNNIFPFEKGQDLEEILRKQWSGYFQRLLHEERFMAESHKKMDVLSEQFEDLKAAILTSIENDEKRDIARGVVSYRRLLEILLGMNVSKNELYTFSDSFDKLLEKHGVEQKIDGNSIGSDADYRYSMRSYFVKSDKTFYEVRIPFGAIERLAQEWDSFKMLQESSKKIIVETIQDLLKPSFAVRYHKENIMEYANNVKSGVRESRDE